MIARVSKLVNLRNTNITKLVMVDTVVVSIINKTACFCTPCITLKPTELKNPKKSVGSRHFGAMY